MVHVYCFRMSLGILQSKRVFYLIGNPMFLRWNKFWRDFCRQFMTLSPFSSSYGWKLLRQPDGCFFWAGCRHCKKVEKIFAENVRSFWKCCQLVCGWGGNNSQRSSSWFVSSTSKNSRDCCTWSPWFRFEKSRRVPVRNLRHNYLIMSAAETI